jgi:hypothetical protein
MESLQIADSINTCAKFAVTRDSDYCSGTVGQQGRMKTKSVADAHAQDLVSDLSKAVNLTFSCPKNRNHRILAQVLVSPDAELFSRLWHRFSRLGGIRSHPTLRSAV